MGTLGVVEFVTLAGVMPGFHAEDEAGFAHGGWGRPYADQLQFDAGVQAQPQAAAYLFGRRTYEQMASFWPYQSDDNPMAAHLNRTPKFVATRTLKDLSWANATVLHGELAGAVRDLKASTDGGIAVLGSGVLVEQLLDADLVDQFHLFIHPLVLGSGRTLFTGLRKPLRLALGSVTPSTTGVLMATYDVLR
jgi:dihydrofolate reductase